MNSRMRVLNISDEQCIKNILFTYFEEEITAKTIKLSLLEKNIYVKAYMKTVVSQGLSVGLFDVASDELVGCAFVTCWKNPIEPKNFDLNENTTTLTKLLTFDEEMMEEVPQIVKENTFVYLDIIIVNPRYQNKGIATRLLRRCEKLAHDSGRNMMITVTNSKASQNWAKKCGFKVFKKVLYKDYEDPLSGERIFKDISSPNTGSELCYKSLC